MKRKKTRPENPLQKLMDWYRPPGPFGEFTADPNQPDSDGDTLLHSVARRGTPEEITLLVASKAQVNAVGDLGFTPLHSAAIRGHLGLVKKLVELGADPSIRNEFGETAATAADNRGHTDVAAFLKSLGKH